MIGSSCVGAVHVAKADQVVVETNHLGEIAPMLRQHMVKEIGQSPDFG